MCRDLYHRRFRIHLTANDPSASTRLDAPKSLAPRNTEAAKPQGFGPFALNLLINGLWFIGMVAAAPTGGVLGAATGTELGGKIGIHIMQRKTEAMNPIFTTAIPLLLSGSMGMAAGYTFGAASGAVIPPLGFAAGLYICSATINFLTKDANANAVIELEADVSWVLVEDTP